MQILTTGILFSLVFVADNIQAALSSDGENVCLHTETYETTIEVEVLKPVKEKRKKLCWTIRNFFKCEKTITTLKFVKEPQVVQRTKIVPKCCDGYAEEEGEANKCSPVCLNGCKNGKCVAPSVCACSSGFYGSECEKTCPENFWGNDCRNKCECSNNGNCDNVSGGCHCKSGWRGKSCELPCPDGFYGHYCQEKCNCDNHLCHHKTGECTTTTAENAVITATSPTISEPTAEAVQPTTNEQTTTVQGGLLLDGTEQTAKETVSGETTSDAAVTLGDESASVEMNEEPNKNEKEVLSEERTFSRDAEDVTKIPEEGISMFETFRTRNSTENISIWTGLSEVEKSFDANETNNSVSESKSSSKERTLSLFHFLPSLSIISNVSFLIFIIAAKWIIFENRKKNWKNSGRNGKDKLLQPEDQAEKFFWVNNCTKYPLPDIELNTTPTLETFKPTTPNKGFISKEKEIK